MHSPTSRILIPAAIVAALGTSLLINATIDAATWHTRTGVRMVTLAAALLLPSAAVLVWLLRAGRGTRSQATIVFLGTLPFSLFGSFLAWQVEVSAERRALCDGGDAEACVAFAARKLRRGDPAAALPAFARACELGHGGGCFSWGGRLTGAPAVDAWARACALGESRGCAWAAQHLRRGEGVPADLPRARSLAETGCERDHADSCAEFELLARRP